MEKFVTNRETYWEQFRDIDYTKPVEVYRNLHKKVWSVRQSGLVVAHTWNILLKQVEYKVSETGRKRVLIEQRKNVHAVVRGLITDYSDIQAAYIGLGLSDDDVMPHCYLTYNPYKYSSFVNKENGRPIRSSDFADLDINTREPVIAIWSL